MSKSFLNNHAVRGLRNNNPGNLIRTSNAWQGKIPFPQNSDSKFEQFSSIKWGIRAMLKDLINDIKKGKNTVRKLITEYAPKSENNTESYINAVSKSLGVTPNQTLTTINNAFLILLSRSIFRVELGNAHAQIKDSDIQDALEALGEVSSENLKVIISKTWKPLIPALVFLSVFFC